MASLGAGLAGTASPYVAIGCLLLGSVAASALDGVGGIPFLRAVRHHERQQMAAVYRTYIDCSELIPAFVFAFALLWLPIGMVFVILSLALAVIGWISWRYRLARTCRNRSAGTLLWTCSVAIVQIVRHSRCIAWRS